MAVLDEMAHQKKTVIHYSDPPEVTQYPIGFHYRGLDIRLGDVGMYQVANASLAIDVVLGLWSHALDAAIISGLRTAHWPDVLNTLPIRDRIFSWMARIIGKR